MALFGRPTPQDEIRAANYREWLVRRDPFAIASLVLGVFSLTHLGTLLIDGIAAIVLGAAAIARISLGRDPQRPHGTGLAVIGIVTAAASLVLAAALYWWA
jgi:hypothetical protein